MKTLTYYLSIILLIVLVQTVEAQKHKVMIITGQNNHYWQGSSPIIKQIFDQSGMFEATIVTSPAKGEDMSAFRPDFSAYDLICMDYNGDMWPESTRNNFVQYMKKGGALVVFHASDNAFSEWEEYNRMIGVGGWGGRTEAHGPIVYWHDGKFHKDTSAGRGGAHGRQDEYVVHTRNASHPIMQGLPEKWLHTKDELYHSLRGPAKQMTVLATASQPKERGGSGRQEPVLMTIKYGKGRVFHSVMGHAGAKNLNTVKCAGFITTLLRGAEWAVTGKVTQPVSRELPTENETRVWESAKAPDMP